MKTKRSVAGLSRTMAYHPEARHAAAEMDLELDAIRASVDREWSGGVDHGPAWPARLAAAKYRAVEGAGGR